MKIYFYILKEFCKFLARLIGKVQYLDITSILSIKNCKFQAEQKKEIITTLIFSYGNQCGNQEIAK